MQDNEADLTDEQIGDLLKAAEQRLRKTATSLSTSSKRPQPIKPYRAPYGDNIAKPYIQTIGPIARIDPSRMLDASQRNPAERILVAAGPSKVAQVKPDAGPDWFHMPRTDQSLKKDIQLLKLRGVIDPKRHYKKPDPHASSDPPFAQRATLIEGPAEYFSARLRNRERRKGFVEGVLAEEAGTRYFARRYAEIQVRKKSGRRGAWKEMMRKRRGKS